MKIDMDSQVNENLMQKYSFTERTRKLKKNIYSFFDFAPCMKFL